MVGRGRLGDATQVENYSGTIGEEGVEEGMGKVVSRPTFVRKPSKEARLRKMSYGDEGCKTDEGQ